MVIEWLKFRVEPDKREQYIQKDAEIWTKALSKYPGFMGKEVWISSEDLSEVILVTHWESFEKWHAIPAADLERTEKEFSQAMGNTYELVQSAGYQVRNITR